MKLAKMLESLCFVRYDQTGAVTYYAMEQKYFLISSNLLYQLIKQVFETAHDHPTSKQQFKTLNRNQLSSRSQ